MRIGVLGTGDVGKALGRGFLALDHQVMMGSRDASSEKVVSWVKAAGGGASGGTFAEAAKFGDVVLLACLGSAVESVIELAGPDNLAGKVLVDATNPLDFSHGMPPRLAEGLSGGERVQQAAPGARVVKAFNTVGNADMVKPDFPGGPPDMFLCGNDDAAKGTVGEICRAFGWGVVDLGGIDASHYLEALCIIWVRHGARTGGWRHAFKLLQK